MNARSFFATPPCAPPAARLRSLAAALAAAALLAMPGCAATPQVMTPSGASLPKWEGHQRELFDDNIDPVAVGLSMEGVSPRSDPFLRERAQTADVTARLRVQTVTIDSIGDQKTYHLGMQVGFPTLTPAKVADKSFELSIKSTSRAYGIARAFDSRLRGSTFIGFIGRFQADDGEVEVHFHFAPDNAAVAAAVKEAVALQELSGQ